MVIVSGTGHVSWPNGDVDAATVAKQELRRRLLGRRRALTRGQRAAAAGVLSEVVLGLVRELGATTVAAYVPAAREPGSALLLEALRAAGTRVLLPVVLADGDLDWTAYAAHLATGRCGMLEAAGDRLGVGAVTQADLVVVPAIAVDAAGARLGRGGGSYDRALGRVPSGIPLLALLHDGELVEQVPVQPHDLPVTMAATPSGGLMVVQADR